MDQLARRRVNGITTDELANVGTLAIEPAAPTRVPIGSVGVGRRRWIRAARPRQWVKAVLVLAAPLVAVHVGIGVAARAAAAVVLVCAAASGTYLINDAIDVEADRHHPIKRLRPIAAGEIALGAAVAVAIALLLAAPAAAMVLSTATALWLGGYAVLTVAYSTFLKRIPVVDVITIAAGFVVRVLIGGAATATPVSGWFLAAVASAAVMIAVGKRRSELRELGAGVAVAHRTALATYRDGLTASMIVVAAVAHGAALVGWATIGSGGPRLEGRWACALVAPLLIGIGRYLTLALSGRAARPEDLVRDRTLLGCAVAVAVLFIVGHALS